MSRSNLDMQLPTEIYDLITLYVEINGNTRTQHWQQVIRHYPSPGVKARQSLAQLRLVSKAFYHSVSPRLFRHVGVRSKPNSPATTPRSAFFRLEEVSKSQYAGYVRAVDFSFHRFSRGDADQEYVKYLARLLKPCLSRFKNIRTLGFHVPYHDLPEDATRLYVSSIVELFRDISFPGLEELALYFPLTHDFGGLFQTSLRSQKVPIMNVPLQRLRHLELGVYAHTNSRHVRYWTHPIRPENVALPNELYENYLYQVLGPAINVKILSIRSMDPLNLDSVDFSPSLRHLQSFSLSGVSISADKLLSLFVMDNQFTESKVRHVEFNIVKLTAGTWGQVLLGMSTLLPRLVDFTSESSGYSSTGSSAYLVPVHREYGMTYSMETGEALDIAALGHLQRVINGNRVKAGLKPYTEDNFEYLEEPPLEMLQQIQLDINIS